MIQKLLTVGSSKAVTVPKNALRELGLEDATSVSVHVDSTHKRLIISSIADTVSKNEETVEWTKRFIEQYRPALEALSKK